MAEDFSINDRLKYIYDLDSFTYKDPSLLNIPKKILLDILLEYHLVRALLNPEGMKILRIDKWKKSAKNV